MTSSDIQVDLIINKLTQSQYDELCSTGRLSENQLYLITDAYVDAKGNRVLNVGTPTISSDAATKAYVDAHGGIWGRITGDITAQSDLVGALSSKSDVSYVNSICSDLQGRILSVGNSLSGYYLKTETSSAVQISSKIWENTTMLSAEIDRKSKVTMRDWEDEE